MEKRVIGVTGGVGSGKSTVLEILRQEFGAEVIQADLVAKELMEPGGAGYEAVREAFGEEVLAADGSIDRGRLSELIFADRSARERLNGLTHPLVRQEAARRIGASEAALVIYEAALPREAGMRELCGEVWVVRAPEEERIRRLMADRGYSREKCLEIIGAQLTEGGFAEIAGAVIENGGTLAETREQIRRLVEYKTEKVTGKGTIFSGANAFDRL